MDIRSEIINSMIFSLKNCKNKNKYILLLNELLSLFPLHAEKSLRLCLKSKIKKYTLVKGKDSTKDYALGKIPFRINRKARWKKKDSCFSDDTATATGQKREELSGERLFMHLRSKNKKTRLHFFLVCGNNKKYIVFQNFCSCFYFKEKVLCNNADVLCKHLLSVRLAECFNNYANIFLDSSLFFEWYLKKMHL
ncbi:zinc finger protein, putative [Plasmodium ovale]|uniref:Zinc finger protein, putative n=1 Tax=Plasmodium ovale TaxID=36330 RepID=A0A1C3KRW9_PLAOA|nr:zinc finger protein, putative [Plasmodium ovale]